MAELEQGSFEGKERIGEILIKRGLIKHEQLKEAIEIQKREKGLIGEILVKLGYVEEVDIVVAMIIQCGFPFIAINKYELDPKILKLIPEDIVREFHVIPLDKVGNVLSVVMSDPLNKTVKEKLEEITNCKIAPFISTKSEILAAIERGFDKKVN